MPQRTGRPLRKLNLVADVPVPIRIRGQDIIATPELVGDVDEIDNLLMFVAAVNPGAAAFIGISAGQTGTSTGPAWRTRSGTDSGSCAGIR